MGTNEYKTLPVAAEESTALAIYIIDKEYLPDCCRKNLDGKNPHSHPV